MYFEAIHNPDVLPSAKRVVVRNLRSAKDLIRKLMDERRPRGLRLRHNYDTLTNSIYLEARDGEAIRFMVTHLRNSGNVLDVDNRRMRQQ